MYFNYDGLFRDLAIFFICVGFAIGAIVFWLAPMIWGWIKPWIHALTA